MMWRPTGSLVCCWRLTKVWDEVKGRLGWTLLCLLGIINTYKIVVMSGKFCKRYSNPVLTVIGWILYNLKWLGLFFSIPNFLYWLDRATSNNSWGTGEYLFWYSFLLVISIILFCVDKKWKAFCDAMLNRLA